MSTENWYQNYFEKTPLTDKSLTKFRYQEIYPPVQDVNETTELQFDTGAGSLKSFIDLSRSYLTVKLHIAQDAAGYHKIPLADNTLALQSGCSLFRSVNLFINDTDVGRQAVQEPALCQLFHALSRKHDLSEQTAQHIFYDTNTFHAVNEINTFEEPSNHAATLLALRSLYPGLNAVDAVNLGHFYRLERMSDTVSILPLEPGQDPEEEDHIDSFYIRIPLSTLHPFCFVRKPMRAARIRLMLERETKWGKVLVGAIPDGYNACRAVLDQITLNVCMLEPNPLILRSLNDGLTKNAKIPIVYKNLQCRKYDITGDNINQDVFSNGPRITHVIVGFQKLARAETVTASKLVFDRPSTFIGRIEYGGIQYPMEREYSTDRPSGWSEVYEAFMKTFSASEMEYPSTPGASHISYDQFKQVYPLFCFDLRPGDQTFLRADQGQRVTLNFTLKRDGSAIDGAGQYRMIVYIVTDEYAEFSEEDGSARIKFLQPSDLVNMR